MLKLNKVITILIFSDMVLLTGLGFVAPILAIFLTDNIKGGNVEIAGFAAAVYWIVMSLVIVPFGKYLDKNHGEFDDLWFVSIGNFLAALSVFGFLFSSLPWHIYFFHAIYALGMGMNIPGYTAIFTRHVDKGKEALSWSTRAAFVGVGSGIAGALGGVIAHRFGFNTLFIGVGIFIIFSALLPFLIFKNISSKNQKRFHVPPSRRGEAI